MVADPPLVAAADSSVEFIVPLERAGRRLDQTLVDQVNGVSRSQMVRHIGEGYVSVNGQRCASASQKLRSGDRVAWRAPHAVAVNVRAQAIPLHILFEDPWLVVLDKAAGQVVHPAPGHEDGTLVNALLAHCQDLQGIGGELRPGIVHRLDKDTSGVMVVAKDEQTLAALGAAFKAHSIERQYEALVMGVPPAESGRIETLHGRDPHDRKKFTTRVKSGRQAITNWRCCERFQGAARLEATLETGRTHQVRIHCAGLGCPILGDPVYGRPPREAALRTLAAELGRQMLHARKLGFVHPRTHKTLTFEAPPPADFQRALAFLRARPLAPDRSGRGG